MAEAAKLMAGKRGIVFGVANNRSIAWGITKACRDQGAEIALTYQGDALKKRVEPLAAEIGSKLALPCDVTDEASVEGVFKALADSWGSIDFLVHAVAFSDKQELDGRYVDTSKDNFVQTLLVSCYSFTALAKRAEGLMPNGG
jgi:enoyl-[acyl-carrier protein] reductase I